MVATGNQDERGEAGEAVICEESEDGGREVTTAVKTDNTHTKLRPLEMVKSCKLMKCSGKIVNNFREREREREKEVVIVTL